MTQLYKQVFVNAPLEKVWQISIDTDKFPEWVQGVRESRVSGFVKSGKGLEWQEKCEFGSQILEINHEFTEVVPMQKTVTKSGLPMGGSMERIATFKPVGDQIEVNVQLSWDLGMIGMFVTEEKVYAMFEKGLAQTLENWKARAEKP